MVSRRPEARCVVNKINEFKATLKDPTDRSRIVRFALRFLIHCIKYLHMQMHVATTTIAENDTQFDFSIAGRTSINFGTPI